MGKYSQVRIGIWSYLAQWTAVREPAYWKNVDPQSLSRARFGLVGGYANEAHKHPRCRHVPKSVGYCVNPYRSGQSVRCGIRDFARASLEWSSRTRGWGGFILGCVRDFFDA